MTIVKVLKGIFGISGLGSIITAPLGTALKPLREAVMIGIPGWDPPPELPPGPPDDDAAQRAKETIAMATQQELEAFNKVMQIWRKVRDGQPREPARFPGRPGQTPIPLAAEVTPRETP